MNILENKFYKEKPFLTAEKSLANQYEKTREYISNHNIKTCVMVFCKDLEDILQEISQSVITLDNKLKAGEDLHPLFVVNNIMFVLPFVGGPAAAFLMEELSYLGIKNFIACGSAGLIDNSFDSKKLFVVTNAIRDEGTSYHYADEHEEATTNKNLTLSIEKTLKQLSIPYEKGTVWTTDAFYRETPSAIQNNKALGAKCVDMECATWCIVAKKLGLNFAEFLYFSDSVCDNNWDFVGTSLDRIETKAFITKLAYEIANNFDSIPYKNYKCLACGYEYIEQNQDSRFHQLPKEWKCPICGAPKEVFQ